MASYEFDQQETVGTFPSETLTAATDVLRRGLTPEAERDALGAIAAHCDADDRAEPATPDSVRAAALEAIAAEPETAEALGSFEAWLEGEIHGGAGLPIACRWALPAADVDLERVTHEARLYIDAYPFEGRVVGNLPERTARWLAKRVAMFVEPAERVAAVRRAIATLADAAEPGFPASARSLRAAASDTDDDALWYGLSLHIAETEMRRKR